ncbi:hypothetical protein Aperf_G00000026099 [Anoplocephala perfoliata]
MTFAGVVWCSVSKTHPIISDAVLLLVYLRLVRLPRLCCGLTSLDSDRYRASVVYLRQEGTFQQHNLNSMQHKLDMNELELLHIRQYIYSLQRVLPTDGSSQDCLSNSEITSAEHLFRIPGNHYNFRGQTLHEESGGGSHSGASGGENLALQLGVETNGNQRVKSWIESCALNEK